MRATRNLWMTGLAAVGPLLAALLTVSAPGQTHKVAKPETVVRAVGVYEWTGELAKPAASRLIPVTLYIDKHLEDAGVYLARPVPFVLETGDVYDLEEAGVSKGTLELAFARHLQAATVADAYDDGWFGYGSYKPLPVPKKPVIRKTQAARTSGIETASTVADPDKPHFTNKAGQVVTPASAGTDAGKTDDSKKDDAQETDPDRPKLTRKKDADAASADGQKDSPSSKTSSQTSSQTAAQGSTDSTGSTPAGDPDRPTMKRRSGNDTASTPAASDPAADSTTPAADDPDRPTLKRHSVEDAKKKAKSDSGASVTATGSLNDDPDRPNLHRGKPTRSMSDADLPKLSGLPIDLKQMVAVSDASNRPVHDFARAWEDEAERVAVLKKMQDIAQAQLAAFGAAPSKTKNAAQASTGASPRPANAATASRPNSKLRRPLSPLKIATVAMQDEQLKGYLLSYGDTPTFVYQAHTAGTGADLRYVTVVAQRDAQGEPALVLHNVTDATHLDSTPRLRLVDAVDVEASNRASLLFEMRGQSSRQFGVYRVLGLQAQQIFTTGAIQ